MKKMFSRAWKVIGAALLVSPLLLALLQTPPAKKTVAAALSYALSRSPGLEVRIENISGWIPADIRIGTLEVGDAEGLWLRVENTHIRWMLRDLLKRRIRVAHLGAETIEIFRFPTLGKPTASEPAVLPGVGNNEPKSFQPLEIELEHLAIKQLKLNGSAEGFPLEYSMHSTGIHYLPSGKLTANLTVGGDAEGEIEFSEEKLTLPRFIIRFGSYTANGNLFTDFSEETAGIRLNAELTNGAKSSGSIQVDASFSGEEQTADFQTLEIHGLDFLELSMEGTVSPKSLNLNGTLAEFDLNELPISGISNFTGRAAGTVSLTGSPAEPQIRAGLDVMELSSVQEAFDELPKLNFHSSARLADGQFHVSTHITNSTLGRLEGELRMPCAFSLTPFIFKPEPENIHAALNADMNISVLNQLAFFADQRIAGQLKAELIYDQNLSGTVQMDGGSYEHYRWGAVIRDVTLDLMTTDDGLQVQTATATDGGSGRIAMTGGVVSNRLALALDLSRARIIRRDDVETTLSGKLKFEGPLTRPELTGKLTLNRADILPDNMAPKLPPLLTNYDATARTNPVSQVEKKQPLPFGLDVQVDLADQVFVNASMIDSAWGGHLRIIDLPEGLSVEGRIEPKRGSVSFAGKKFNLTDGRIDLDGSVPARPSMNQLTGEYNRGDFTARLILNGRIDNPDFRLESSPPMPEDEVLSHVLFGRDTSSITPYQIYQVAAAARQLSGGMEGPGFMHRVQQTIGVDTLEWREDEGEASILSAGKYLTSDLYVEMNRSLDEKGGTSVIAEYDVTKHFSIESSSGTQMRPGIGINWKFDY